MFIAGEASGDTLGAELVKALRTGSAPLQSRESEPESESAPFKRDANDFTFFGAGGPKMAEAGVDLAFDLSAYAVVGIVEVVRNYSKFKAFFDQLIQLALNRKPDVLVLIDYPGFNLRFAKAIKQKSREISGWDLKLVYYVSPQIWAWHESRIHQIAHDIDLLLSIFPFEKDWYAARKPDFKVEFVGHPLIDRYAQRHFDQPAPADRLLLLPGSRERELRKHLPPMIPAAQRLAREEKIPVLMVLPHERLKTTAQAHLANAPEITLQIGNLEQALTAATAAIASSGTVTMECAYFGVPTVVLYRTSWSTYWLGRRFIRVKYLAMPNLLADRPIYPEFIQSQASEQNLYSAARELLTSEPKRAAIKTALQQVIASLGPPGASHRAARAIFGL